MNFQNCKFKLSSMLILLMVMSCEQVKDIEYELPFEGEQTVFYGFLVSGDSSVVQVYKSQSPLIENPDFTVEKAELTIFEDGNAVQNLTFENNSILKYSYPHNAQSLYHIEVEKNGELIQSSPISLSSAVAIDSLTYIISNDETVADFSFYFTDIAESSYYSYSIEKYAAGERILERGMDANERYREVFSDDEFKNTSKKIVLPDEDLRAFRYDENQNLIGLVDIDSVVINLFSLSEEFYLRRQSEIANDEGEIGRMNSNNEAIWSNVVNGYGFVGGVGKKTFSVTF